MQSNLNQPTDANAETDPWTQLAPLLDDALAELGETDRTALVLRYFAEDQNDWLVVTNLERDLPLGVAPEPLLAPPMGKRWKKVLSTEDPPYGGSGTAPVDTEMEGWLVPGRCTVVMRPVDAAEGQIVTRIKAAGSAQAPKPKNQSNQPD